MISALRIQGFKRFTDHRFLFSDLTVLTGTNGAGKSSVVQALLLARQASTPERLSEEGLVQLNGPFGLELGTFEDVANYEIGDEFAVELLGEKECGERWKFHGKESQRFAFVEGGASGLYPVFSQGPRTFQYLSAERQGPRVVQGSQALPEDWLEVGRMGEHTAQVVDALGALVIDEKRVKESSSEGSSLLKAQAEMWLSKITRPIQIDTVSFPGAGSYALKFRTGEEWVKPTNMGFGVSFSLPIIVAGLSAPERSFLIVENPEAHLSPSGQSQMGIFLAVLAASGVQVLVETHSDHIINGIRRAIGDHNILEASKAVVHHFDSSEPCSPIALSFTPTGGISDWPTGFFDQYQIDVSALTRIRRRR